jgi:hypothetical protein
MMNSYDYDNGFGDDIENGFDDMSYPSPRDGNRFRH